MRVPQLKSFLTTTDYTRLTGLCNFPPTHTARFQVRDCRNNVLFSIEPSHSIKMRGKQFKQMDYEQKYAPRLNTAQ